MKKKDLVESFQFYSDEHDRLEELIDASENIWEDRTYQIAAGGLTISFGVFSFLSENNVGFDWQMGLITGIYAFCLLLNYISQRVAIKTFRESQDMLCNKRKNGEEYNEDEINCYYESKDKYLNLFNVITQWLLILNVIYTLLFTFFRLSSI